MLDRPDTLPSWPQFAGWALCGAGAGFVVVGAFTLGPLVLPLVLVLAVLVVLMNGANVSALGAIAGPAVWAFALAWLNRQGPGSVCSTTPTSSSCTDEWSPWPFLVVGLLLVAVPTIWFARVRRLRASRQPA